MLVRSAKDVISEGRQGASALSGAMLVRSAKDVSKGRQGASALSGAMLVRSAKDVLQKPGGAPGT